MISMKTNRALMNDIGEKHHTMNENIRFIYYPQFNIFLQQKSGEYHRFSILNLRIMPRKMCSRCHYSLQVQ